MFVVVVFPNRIDSGRFLTCPLPQKLKTMLQNRIPCNTYFSPAVYKTWQFGVFKAIGTHILGPLDLQSNALPAELFRLR